MARTQVAIIGAGPAGLFLALQLHAEAIDCVVIERRDRAYVEARVRAGVLEPGTVALMQRLGVADRLHAEGQAHDGTNIAIDGDLFRLDLRELTGAVVTVYGQQEVMRDLFDAAAARHLPIEWLADDVTLSGLDSDRPTVTWNRAGVAQRLDCDFVIGCDGDHGISRRSVPAEALTRHTHAYPFGWLGILADVPPVDPELIYANHDRGFALASMRSSQRSRYYIQCAVDERIEDWPDARFWDELCLRLGPQVAAAVTRGPSIEKSIAPLRSAVTEPMRWGRLFLAGDAAHIVPPTGAKGMNLAVSDVMMLAEALVDHYRGGGTTGIDGYSARALSRIWKAERFSWWFTSLTHRFPGMDGFARRLQIAELDYIRTSIPAQRTLAENYVGLKMPPYTRYQRGFFLTL